jgi:hypothetical protein
MLVAQGSAGLLEYCNFTLLAALVHALCDSLHDAGRGMHMAAPGLLVRRQRRP